MVDLRYVIIKNPLETPLYRVSVIWVEKFHVAVEIIANHLKIRFARD